jgi:stress response protein SCP2
MDIRKGQRLPLSQLLKNTNNIFQIELSISGIEVDYACFCLNDKIELVNDEYLILFDQKQTPCKAISLTLEKSSAIFSCDLNKLPDVVDMLSFTASIDGDETMQKIQSGYLKFFVDNEEVACFNFNGSDFNIEKSLILGEIYHKNGEWRFSAFGLGFNDGLEKIIANYGGEISKIESTLLIKENNAKNIQFEGNIFTHIVEQAKRIEAQWTDVFQGILSASVHYEYIDKENLNTLNIKFKSALLKLNADLESPTLILATTGTTSSGKSTIVNLLCGADLMPRMAQEMSAGIVHINHSADKIKKLQVYPTQGALWECGEWIDLADDEIQERLKTIMDSFNQSRGINQPAKPHIELTYPIACFSNKNLLKLSNIPLTTHFKIMDLPGLRNQQDITNSEDIKNCRDALCLVAYNMEETDETRRLELVNQVLEQIKQMGGSPARMLFVLNRIDVFRKDPDWERYQSEHIIKTKSEITDILYRELPEHRDVLDTLSYSTLSSLPALHAQRIKTNNHKYQAAKELDTHFTSLISQDILDDLPRSTCKWNEHEFDRVSETVWQNSYGGEFFNNLDSHIQAHFPTLVIPTIVEQFEQEVSGAIGEVVRTCYSEINSSIADYEKTIALLHEQNEELRDFLDNAKNTLQEAFDNLLEDLKKNPSNEEIFEFLAEDLLATDIYRGRISRDKLNPLYSCFSNIRVSLDSIIRGVEQTLVSNKRNFSNTTIDQLPERLQNQILSVCNIYIEASNKKDQSYLEHQLDTFLNEMNIIANEVITIKSDTENSRIYDTVELLMKHYLNYLQEGVEERAAQWNLSIGHHVLKELPKPAIRPIKLKGQLEEKSREEGLWYTLWIKKRTIRWKELPSPSTLCKEGSIELTEQIESLVEPFHTMMRDYLLQLNEKIIAEQNKVLRDFETKLSQANAQHHENFDKVIHCWQPLEQQSNQLNSSLKQLVKTGKSA